MKIIIVYLLRRPGWQRQVERGEMGTILTLKKENSSKKSFLGLKCLIPIKNYTVLMWYPITVLREIFTA